MLGRHRGDIDGLRAVAVIPIILFHLGNQSMPGGYVGVDIFFVISGFLIGNIVVNDLAAGRFSFSRFYLRRIRRILPALVVVLAATTLACLLLLFPNDLSLYAKALLAALFSAANIYFYTASGYFDAHAVERPLLHLWSLGVEEQFYLLFPLGMWLLHKYLRRFTSVLVLIAAAASLTLSIWLVSRHPDAAFYLLPGRAWELLLGTLVIYARRPILDQRGWREGLAWAGAAAIIGSVLLLRPATPFPGAAALPACLGAAAVIAAGAHGRTSLGAVLGWGPLRLVGLISFSLYLWHWPLIVLFLYAAPDNVLTAGQQVTIAVLTVLLSLLSWRWIEQPFRSGTAAPARVYAWAGAVTGALAAVAVALLVSHGVPGRFPARAERLASVLGDTGGAFGRCVLASSGEFGSFAQGDCVRGDPARTNILLLGNSHAAHLQQGLAATGGRDTKVMLAAGFGWGCVPLVEPVGSGPCPLIWKHVFGTVLQQQPVDLAIISANWEEPQLPGLTATLARLRALGIPTIVIGPAPQFRVPLPRILAVAALRGAPGLPARLAEPSPRRLDPRVRQIAEANGAGYLSAYRVFCATSCVLAQGDMPMLFDTDHLTAPGSRLVALAIARTPSWQAALRHADARRAAAAGKALR